MAPVSSLKAGAAGAGRAGRDGVLAADREDTKLARQKTQLSAKKGLAAKD